MRLVLHGGIHKTGSTSIQRILGGNRSTLFDHSILYPQSGVVGSNNHSRLAWEIRQGQADDEGSGWSDLREEIATTLPDVCVISGEEFEFLNAAEVAVLRDQLARLEPTEIRVVLYLRRQDLVIRSEYLQWVKTGVTDDSFDGVWRRYAVHDRFNYLRLYNLWNAAFAEEQLVFRPFEKGQLEGGDLIADFLRHTGLHVDPSTLSGSSEMYNVSPGERAAELYRLLGRFLSLAGVPEAERAILLGKMNKHVDVAAGEDQPFVGYTGRQALNCLEKFDQSNAALAQKLFGRDQLFFDAPAVEPIREPTSFPAPVLMQLLRQLARQLG